MADTSESGQITQCPECREDIKVGAKKCKHCGADLSGGQYNWGNLGWFIFFVVLFISVFINWINKDPNNNSSQPPDTVSNQQVETPKATIKITAQELYAQYEANEIQADNKYKNDLLEVSGIVTSISKDVFNASYITLKTDNDFNVIHCTIADSEKSKASELQKGAPIVLEGENSHMVMGSVLLNNCIIK